MFEIYGLQIKRIYLDKVETIQLVEMFVKVFFQSVTIVFGTIEIPGFHDWHTHFVFRPHVIDEVAAF